MGEETGGQTASEAPGNQPEPPAASSVLAPPPRPLWGPLWHRCARGRRPLTYCPDLLPQSLWLEPAWQGCLGTPVALPFPGSLRLASDGAPAPSTCVAGTGPLAHPVGRLCSTHSGSGAMREGSTGVLSTPSPAGGLGRRGRTPSSAPPGRGLLLASLACALGGTMHLPAWPRRGSARVSFSVLRGVGGGPGSPAPPRAHLSAPEDTPWGVPVCVLRSDRGSGPPSTRRLVLVPSRPWKELPGVAPRGQVRGGGAHGRTSPRRPSAGAAGRAEAPPATTWPPAALPVQVPARLGGDAGA